MASKDDLSRLSIIVPYRDRQEHLDRFVHHLKAYFQRDKIDKNIPCQITIVEQADDQLFNRGMLLNIGYSLTKSDNDYFCFHDVDYLPIWADYSYPDLPTRIIWYGAHQRPLRPGGKMVVRHNYNTLFGGVVLFTREHFFQVNGFSNEFWGWGSEDIDLRNRCHVEGLKIRFRDGTFSPLPHVNQGLNEDLTFNEIGARNYKLAKQKQKLMLTQREHMHDGLSNLKFEVVAEQALMNSNEDEHPSVQLVSVKLTERSSVKPG